MDKVLKNKSILEFLLLDFTFLFVLFAFLYYDSFKIRYKIYTISFLT